jgi:hypothetical protein
MIKKIITFIIILSVLMTAGATIAYGYNNGWENLTATNVYNYVADAVVGESELDVANETIATLQEQLATEQAANAALEAEKIALETQVIDKTAEIAAKDAEIASNLQTIASLQVQIDALEAEEVVNAAIRTDLQQQIAAMLSTNETLTTEKTALQASVDALTADLELVNGQLTAANSTITTLTSQILDLQATIATLEAAMQETIYMQDQELGTYSLLNFDGNAIPVEVVNMAVTATITDLGNDNYRVNGKWDALQSTTFEFFYQADPNWLESKAAYLINNLPGQLLLGNAGWGTDTDLFEIANFIDPVNYNQTLNLSAVLNLWTHKFGIWLQLPFTMNLTFEQEQAQQETVLMLSFEGSEGYLPEDITFSASFTYDEFSNYYAIMDVFTPNGPVQFLYELHTETDYINWGLEWPFPTAEDAFNHFLNQFLANIPFAMLPAQAEGQNEIPLNYDFISANIVEDYVNILNYENNPQTQSFTLLMEFHNNDLGVIEYHETTINVSF